MTSNELLAHLIWRKAIVEWAGSFLII